MCVCIRCFIHLILISIVSFCVLGMRAYICCASFHHTHTHTQNYLLLHAISFHYTKCFYENYTVRRITHKSYVIAITLLGKFFVPFIYANWLHVIASKLKSFIMSNALCDGFDTHITPMKCDEMTKTLQSRVKTMLGFIQFGAIFCCLVCDCLKFSSDILLIHSYKPVTKMNKLWMRCHYLVSSTMLVTMNVRGPYQRVFSRLVCHTTHIPIVRYVIVNMQILWQ